MPDVGDACDARDVGECSPSAESAAGSPASFVVEGARAPAMRPVLHLADRAARSTVPVLITGESGAGKRSLARWIHGRSSRRAGPLIVVGSAAVSDALLGGGRRRAHAMFADAAGGTLVIDALVELPSEAQAALVQLLDSPALRAHGAAGTRVIATSQDAARPRLRADLYYAISVIAISVPPLRERIEDIPALVTSALARSTRGRAAITDAALAHLVAADWPGNVRELETAIARAVALSDDGVIDVDHVADAGATSTLRRPHRSSCL